MSHAWMPFYVADYLADTTHLSTVEHGAYMLLIMHYWQHAGLPSNARALARICRTSDEEWTEIEPTLSGLFTQPGWKHKRIDQELEKAEFKHSRRVEAGKAGGIAKSAKVAKPKQTPSNATSIAPSNALASSSQPQSHNDASHHYTREQIDEIEGQVRQAAGLENDTSPGLLVVGPILDLIAKGYTLNGDILPAASKLKATGKHPSTWAYLVKMVEAAKAETAAIKPAAPVVDPVVFIPQSDRRWNGCAARYEKSCGLKAKASESEGGVSGRRFPKRIVDEVEREEALEPASLKRTPEAA